MPNIFTLIRYLPVPRSLKTEWHPALLDRAYGKDIAAARKAKYTDKAESLERDHQFEIQMHREEDDDRLTRHLRRQARRLHVPLPPYKDKDGSESDYWYEGNLTYRWLLTTRGIAAVRDEIRKERKARHEARAVWIPWLSAITGAIGAATGLAAILLKGGPQ